VLRIDVDGEVAAIHFDHRASKLRIDYHELGPVREALFLGAKARLLRRSTILVVRRDIM
jgi:hypothetical protein